MTEWIAIADQLPPEKGEYLTWSPDSYWKRQVHVWDSSVNCWEHEYLRKKRTELFPKTWITHWMPLPGGPK